jgi:hypothetical protein
VATKTKTPTASTNGKTAAAAKTETAAPAPVLQISKIQAETILVPVVGTSPLIMHNWSEKARRIMLETQQGKKAPKEVRNPEADYLAAFYRIAAEDGSPHFGLPVTAFKQCTVSAARFYGKNVTMTALQQCLFFRGVRTPADRQELVEVFGEPHMREDMVGVGVNGTDLRYRPEFDEWSALLTVTYVRSMVDRGSVLSLIDAGGMGVGVGDWRPEKRGTFGTFALDQSKEVQVLNG